MAFTGVCRSLTEDGARAALDGAVARARQMGIPFCIAVVDQSGLLKAFARMDGAKYLSIDSSIKKAMTAASAGKPTGGLPPDKEVKLALATDGKLTNLAAGLPLIAGGECVGAIGVGSGTSEEDLEVAKAGVVAFEAGRDQ